MPPVRIFRLPNDLEAATCTDFAGVKANTNASGKSRFFRQARGRGHCCGSIYVEEVIPCAAAHFRNFVFQLEDVNRIGICRKAVAPLPDA